MSRISTFPHCNQTGLDEILKCVICYDKLSEAKMCPFCSKLFCKNCIKKWLTENRLQCPHCRSPLRIESVVTCRFVKEINQALESLTSTIMNQAEKCSQHECPLNYYCLTCTSAICSDCAMFAVEHKGHEFKHLSAVYSQHIEQIEFESRTLKSRIKQLETLKSSIDEKIELAKLANIEKNREIGLYIEQVKSKLEEQLNQKLGSLNKKKKEVLEEIRKLEKLQNEIDEETGQTAKSKLISKSSDLVKKLKTIQSGPIDRLDNFSVNFEFESEITPKYESGVFIIKDYSTAKLTSEVLYSSNLEYSGLIWRLKVYPNGNGVAKGNYLSVFLELVKGYGESAKYDYKVEMLNHIDPSRSVLREFSSDFEQGECWGYNRFYKIDLLQEEGYLDMEDSLKLNFFVRAPTFFQLSKDQSQFIQNMKERENNYKRKIGEFMDRLETYGIQLPEEVSEDHKENDDEFIRFEGPNSGNSIQGYMVSPEEVSSDSGDHENMDWGIDERNRLFVEDDIEMGDGCLVRPADGIRESNLELILG